MPVERSPFMAGCLVALVALFALIGLVVVLSAVVAGCT